MALPGLTERLPLQAMVVLLAHQGARGLAPALAALAGQQGQAGLPLGRGTYGVLVVGDVAARDAAIAAGACLSLPLSVLATDTADPAAMAWQGLQAAAQWLREAGTDPARGAILLTNAALRVAPTWINSNLAALRPFAGRRGADLVLGRVVPVQDGEAERDRRDYARLLDHLAARLDPGGTEARLPHDTATGADSLAMTMGAQARLASLPPTLEAGALACLAREAGLRPAHNPLAMVAAEILPAPGPETVPAAWRRLRLQAALRRAWEAGAGLTLPHPPGLDRLADRFAVPLASLVEALQAEHFHAAWAAMQRCSPCLAPRPAPARLGPQMLMACAALALAPRPPAPGVGLAPFALQLAR